MNYLIMKKNISHLDRLLLNMCLEQSPVTCHRCIRRRLNYPTNAGTARMHTSGTDNAQYLSALKHMLTRKAKKSKKQKKYVDVIQGSEHNLVNVRTCVDTLRGNQLSALTAQLYTTNRNTSQHHSNARNHFTDTIRHCDPLAVLPIDNASFQIDNTGSETVPTSTKTENEETIRSTEMPLRPPSILVPDIIEYVRKSLNNGESVAKIVVRRGSLMHIDISPAATIVNKPLIKEFKNIAKTAEVRNSKHMNDLRKKLKLKPVARAASAKVTEVDTLLFKQSSVMVPEETESQILDDPVEDVEVPEEISGVPQKTKKLYHLNNQRIRLISLVVHLMEVSNMMNGEHIELILFSLIADLKTIHFLLWINLPNILAYPIYDTSELRLKSKPRYNVSFKKSTREAIAKQKLSDLEKNQKLENLNANFLSYVDVCVNTKMLTDAIFAIKSYRRMITMSKHWQPKLNNIDIYNVIMEGCAKEGSWNRVAELISCAEEDRLKLNERSYAAILICLGRARQKSAELIRSYVESSETQGFTIENIMRSAPMSQIAMNHILDAVRVIRPGFNTTSTSTQLPYNCELLEKLNDEECVLKLFSLSSRYPRNIELIASYLSVLSVALCSDRAILQYSECNRPFIIVSRPPAPHYLSMKQLEGLYKTQMETEINGSTKILSIEKKDDTVENIEFYRERLKSSLANWKETVESAIDRDLDVLKAQGRHKSHFFFTIYPYMMTLPKKDYVDIILQEIRKLAEGSETYSPTTRQLYRELGTKVCLRYQIRKKRENGSLEQLDNLYVQYLNWYLHPENKAGNTRQKWQQLLQENNAAANLDCGEPMWRSHVLTAIGRFLYNIIIRDVKIDINAMRLSNSKPHHLPAFYTLFRNKGRTCKEEVKPHPTLSRLYRAAAPEDLVFDATVIPMSCPPMPWTSITSGGNLITKTEIIRLPFQAVSQWKRLSKTPVNNLYPVFDSLNQLGAVPWTVNEQVLDVILKVFNDGGSSKLDVPEPPSACPNSEPATPEMTPQERYKAYRQRLAVRRQKAEMYSLWCDALYKLSLANHFRGKVFWLPHNMDFRGRVYPVAPHLNHLGSDLSRSLLVFAKGEPLGEDGFNWLKIHAINLTGTHKKQSMQARLEYANEILSDILDSAENPLNGGMWWTKSEEPWQTLATCMEIHKAVKSGDPHNYISNFPVHQDGSCNGLQHYAALGRDQAGGESVNLTPAPVPQDVYSCVVTIVERERAKDAANGVKVAQILEGFVFRKVIKQTVMTTVYGVTRYGARLQIARQLKDLNEFPKEYVWSASLYLVNKTFESLQEMFTSTKEIQDWFTECARLIAQVCGENVEWVTPLGLPVVQPYSRTTVSHSPDHCKFIGVQASSLADTFERPNIMKQKNAFAPNFVHSLDSSHMMLTSLFSERAGITFVSVHDCYWTHASTVAIMNNICRQQFVALHSQPILQNLSDYFLTRFAYDESNFENDESVGDSAKRNLNRIIQSVPETGSLDLESVLRSPYFFS